MSTSIWNLAHPLRTGFVNLKLGTEFYGTVIRHSRMKKTVTVSHPHIWQVFIGANEQIQVQHKVRHMVHSQFQTPLP